VIDALASVVPFDCTMIGTFTGCDPACAIMACATANTLCP